MMEKLIVRRRGRAVGRRRGPTHPEVIRHGPVHLAPDVEHARHVLLATAQVSIVPQERQRDPLFRVGYRIRLFDDTLQHDPSARGPPEAQFGALTSASDSPIQVTFETLNSFPLPLLGLSTQSPRRLAEQPTVSLRGSRVRLSRAPATPKV